MAQAVADYLDNDHAVRWGLTVEYVVEPQPLGTAGAIRFARQYLKSDPVLVMNGDSFVDADICQFVDFHRQAAAKATLLCVNVQNAGRYGRVVLDKAGRIQEFAEKDPDFDGSGLVSAGVYLLSVEFLDALAEGEASSLEKDVFAHAAAGSLAAFGGRFPFIDIGTPETFSVADKFFEGWGKGETGMIGPPSLK